MEMCGRSACAGAGFGLIVLIAFVVAGWNALRQHQKSVGGQKSARDEDQRKIDAVPAATVVVLLMRIPGFFGVFKSLPDSQQERAMERISPLARKLWLLKLKEAGFMKAAPEEQRRRMVEAQEDDEQRAALEREILSVLSEFAASPR